MRTLVAVLLTIGVSACMVARAVAQSPPVPDVLAWAFVDTSHGGTDVDPVAQRAVVESLFRWTEPGRVIRNKSCERLCKLVLNESLVHGLPLSFCVYSIAETASPSAQPPASAREIRFSAVLSITTRDHHAAVAEQVREILRADGTTASRSSLKAAKVTLTDHRRVDWPSWQIVTVAEHADRIDIGIGDGVDAVARWLAPTRDDHPWRHIDQHRAAISSSTDPRTPLFEAYVDLNLLRRAFPDRFGGDAPARLLAALRLANARNFMLHVRATPSDVGARTAVDATWAVRSQPPESVHRLNLASSDEIQPDWPRWSAATLDAYAAVLADRDAREFAREGRLWTSRSLQLFTKLQSGVAPAVLVESDRKGAACAFGGLVFRLPLREDARPQAVLRAWRDLMSPFESRITADGRTETWWLRPKQPSLVHAVSWGIVRREKSDELVIALDLGMKTEWINTIIARRRGR